MGIKGPNDPDRPDRDFDASAEADKERRRYFRIEEDIILLFREVAKEDIPDTAGIREIPFDSFALSSSLDFLTQESRTVLRRIERDYPEIADFLKVLERKIDLIGRAFLSFEVDLADRTTQKVSLSASGLSFSVDKAFRPGRVLELKMVLMPNLVGLIAYGRVVYCRKNRDPDDLPYQIAVDFVGLSDQNRDLLARHVVRRQLQQLRDRKQSPE